MFPRALVNPQNGIRKQGETSRERPRTAKNRGRAKRGPKILVYIYIERERESERDIKILAARVVDRDLANI